MRYCVRSRRVRLPTLQSVAWRRRHGGPAHQRAVQPHSSDCGDCPDGRHPDVHHRVDAAVELHPPALGPPARDQPPPSPGTGARRHHRADGHSGRQCRGLRPAPPPDHRPDHAKPMPPAFSRHAQAHAIRPASAWVRQGIAALLGALICVGASAEFIDGAELNRWSEAYERQRQGLQSAKDGRDILMFMGYVMGVWDATLGDRDFLCTPDDFASAQMYQIVAKHVRDHPEKWGLPADYLIREAALRTYRCKNKN